MFLLLYHHHLIICNCASNVFPLHCQKIMMIVKFCTFFNLYIFLQVCGVVEVIVIFNNLLPSFFHYCWNILMIFWFFFFSVFMHGATRHHIPHQCLFFFLFLVTLWQVCCMVKTVVVFGGLLSFFSCCYCNINVFSNYGCARVGQHCFFLFPQDIVICKYCYFSFFAKSFCLSMLDVDELASKNSITSFFKIMLSMNCHLTNLTFSLMLRLLDLVLLHHAHLLLVNM
jgi:hypothetical protein